jgi:hypothetical protein
MDQSLRVGMGNRIANLKEKLQPLPKGSRLLPAK